MYIYIYVKIYIYIFIHIYLYVDFEKRHSCKLREWLRIHSKEIKYTVQNYSVYLVKWESIGLIVTHTSATSRRFQ